MVPTCGGVYAWFKKYLVPNPSTCSPEEFAEFLISEVAAPHCLPRSGKLPPLFSILLSSHRRFSAGKLDALTEFCKLQEFRELIADSLTNYGILFQQPLYIGKASCFRDRISDHLTGQSDLKERLDKKAKIELRRCILVCLEIPLWENVTIETTDANLLVEELLSKLFAPSFTERYG